MERDRMPLERRELYASPNGDLWYLARFPDSGRVFVQHEPNRPSGGRVSHIEIGAFLSGGRHGPGHQAPLRRIGTPVAGQQHTMVDTPAAGAPPKTRSNR